MKAKNDKPAPKGKPPAKKGKPNGNGKKPPKSVPAKATVVLERCDINASKTSAVVAPDGKLTVALSKADTKLSKEAWESTKKGAMNCLTLGQLIHKVAKAGNISVRLAAQAVASTLETDVAKGASTLLRWATIFNKSNLEVEAPAPKLLALGGGKTEKELAKEVGAASGTKGKGEKSPDALFAFELRGLEKKVDKAASAGVEADLEGPAIAERLVASLRANIPASLLLYIKLAYVKPANV